MHSDNVIGVLRLHAVAQPVPMKTFLSFQGRLGGRPPSELEFVWPANAFLGVFPYGAHYASSEHSDESHTSFHDVAAYEPVLVDVNGEVVQLPGDFWRD